jgi:uncharacterized membrane protein YhaH (DUF805 family)
VNYQPDYQSQLSGGAIAAIAVFYLVVILFFGWLYVRIIRRAGYSGWWVLMALVPIGNLVMLCLFAFKEWPVHRELNYLRGYAAYTGLPGYAPPPQQYGPGSQASELGPGGPPYGYGAEPDRPGPGQPPATGSEWGRPDTPEGPKPPTP